MNDISATVDVVDGTITDASAESLPRAPRAARPLAERIPLMSAGQLIAAAERALSDAAAYERAAKDFAARAAACRANVDACRTAIEDKIAAERAAAERAAAKATAKLAALQRFTSHH